MALSTKIGFLSASDVDEVWAFTYYLNLPKGKLRGGDIKVKSPFTLDKEPSFSLYKPKDKSSEPYRWN
jgi:hypothetical protein